MDYLNMYKILNEIKPHFRQTKYPYNYWSLEKIIETKNNIKLIWSKDKKFLIDIKSRQINSSWGRAF